MKIDILDAHDRYEYFTNQDFNISECCQNLIDQRPFGNVPFYIFAHARTLDIEEKFAYFTSTGKWPDKTIVWQPRLTKPKAQTNSMLFKAYPGSDVIRVIWMIPQREIWSEYQEKNVSQNQTVLDSIKSFIFNRQELEAPEKDDLTDSQAANIYLEISRKANSDKQKKIILS